MKYLTKKAEKNIKNELDEYKKAYKLVAILFKDKKDKAGYPYLNHLLRVSRNAKTKTIKTIALLHDVLEDIKGITVNDLKALGFSKDVILSVKLLTKNKCLSYDEYITNIIDSKNINVIKVKYADMKDNLDENRLNMLDENVKNKLLNKYKPEINRIEKVLGRKK